MDSSNNKSNENILKELFFMCTFEEISKWVAQNSNSRKFIANPSNASDVDRFNCLFAIQEPLVRALKRIEKRRKNGRDKRLIEAEKIKDYSTIAAILASTASSYWRDHGFIKFKRS